MSLAAPRGSLFALLVLSLSMSPRPLSCQECYSGEVMVAPDNSTSCVCSPGWTGTECQYCGGRLRLENSSGVIRDHLGGGSYIRDTNCLFYIEAASPASSIHLRFNTFFTECQWDYLYIYDGDSLFSPKIGAFTGNLLVPPVEDSVSSSGSGSGSGSGQEEIQEPYQAPLEVTVSSSGPRLLMYFYTDAAEQKDGFEISYWLDYSCPSNCSGQGVCTDNSTCSCHPGWVGSACQLPACPNNCSGNGVCNETTSECQCSQEFMGVDCSSSVDAPRWEVLDFFVQPDTVAPSALARAGHSVVTWGDYMVIYGGYRFPTGDAPEGVGGANETEELQLFRYHFASRQLEVLNSSSESQPEPRYGHTAVVYNDSMFVFGGSKYPSEEITNELWSLDLRTLVWTDHTPSPNPNEDTMDNSTANVTAIGGEGNQVVSVVEGGGGGSAGSYLPIPVRSHTAHAVGTRMVVLLGLSSGEANAKLVHFVQEYDFESGNWTTPSQYGSTINGRTGHSSVYSPDSGLIYVYGGHTSALVDELYSYDPTTHVWRRLSGSKSHRYLHSATLVGPTLMVTYGGCSMSGSIQRDCFSNDLDVYNIACDEWILGSRFVGLPGSGRRHGHSAVVDPGDGSLLVFGGFTGDLHHDLLRLDSGNCSAFPTPADCLNSSVLCVWSTDMGECLPAVEGGMGLVYSCNVDVCGAFETCVECNGTDGCRWDEDSYRCAPEGEQLSPTLQCDADPSTDCDRYTTCDSCLSHQCLWARGSGSNTASCISKTSYNSTFYTLLNCSTTSTCSAHTTCEKCVPSCLWCPSVGQCIGLNSYHFSYVYGQCLGWVNSLNECPVECSTHQSCSSCEDTIDCGWCNDPSDTGLGACMEGGFTESRNTSQCGEDLWYFDTCAACQCNGHSTCVNSPVCEQCQNLTSGDHCERCMDGYWGDPTNGRFCNECDCNGYNPVCNHNNGTCACLDIGVTGNNCRECDESGSYFGDVDNFCYFTMEVGFIYTFGVQDPSEKQTFYISTPRDDSELNFEFEIDSNPEGHTIVVQLFLGRRSENLWLLVNLTDPIILSGEDSFSRDLDDFHSSRDVNSSQIHSFTKPFIRHSSNFTDILSRVSEDDYTHHMWDKDVTLVVYVSNLTNPMTFKITVEQMDLIFLLYFFATFITCFTFLLAAFLSGWYIKRKIDLRRLRRQQYVELQRRVSRGFARIKLIVEKNPNFEAPQSPSYAAVETCKTNRTAILSVFIQLPGDSQTCHPVPGRTGLCLGSTLVRVNPKNSKKKEKGKGERRRGGGRGNSTSLSPNPTAIDT